MAMILAVLMPLGVQILMVVVVEVVAEVVYCGAAEACVGRRQLTALVGSTTMGGSNLM
jgi:hypothetical protein